MDTLYSFVSIRILDTSFVKLNDENDDEIQITEFFQDYLKIRNNHLENYDNQQHICIALLLSNYILVQTRSHYLALYIIKSYI